MCDLFVKYFPDFKVNYHTNTNYSIHFIQDEIVDICWNNVRDKVINDIGDGIFVVMYDEAR